MSNWLLDAVELNARRRGERYAEGQAAGAEWLVECRDLWDAHDEDAGVYFVLCASRSEVDDLVIRMREASSDRILGIYDLREPLASQGGGTSHAQWREAR